MANTRKVESKATAPKVAETKIEKDVTEVKSEIENTSNDEVSDLKKQLEELQRALINMQSNQMTMSQTNTDEESFYEIGTRFVNGVPIYSPRKEIVKEVGFDEVVTVDEHELNSLLKTNFVKEWLEKDILFFTDESVYAKKRINKKYNLDDETFADLLVNNTTTKVINTINEMTKNMKDDPMIHCVFYRIVELSANGKIATMPYDTRLALEKVFEFKIDDAQMLFRGFRNK